MSKQIFAAAAVLLVACQGANNKVTSLSSQKEKASYAIGLSIGKNLKQQNADVDPKFIAAGFEDALKGEKSLMTDDEIRETMMAFQREMMEKQQKAMEGNNAKGEENAKASREFLEKNAKQEGVKVTASGLQYKVIKEGKGPKPKAEDTVSVHYKGTLPDGKEFDSSYKRGQPATFPVGGVIPGWTEALQLMNVGSKYQLFIPPELAYGPRGAGADIGPNQALVFEVELLEIKK